MTFHLRGTVLPDGAVRDVWTLGDRITFERPSQPADTLADGGFLLPGLVDVHTHPGARSEGEPAFDADPRREPAVLRHPLRIVLRGRVVL
jgi:imidazolonepropionase-like amidohydrolase